MILNWQKAGWPQLYREVEAGPSIELQFVDAAAILAPNQAAFVTNIWGRAHLWS